MIRKKTSNSKDSENKKKWLFIHEMLIEQLVPCIENFLYDLNVKFYRSANRLYGPCPVHLGDNSNAWMIWLDGHTTKLNWRCFTHGCHKHDNEVFGRSIFGLVYKILQRDQGDSVTWKDAYKYVANYLGLDLYNMQVTEDQISKQEYINTISKLVNHTYSDNTSIIPKNQILPHLQIPAEYFIARGYQAKTLLNFDVGYCGDASKKFYNRVIVPVYDDSGEYYIGCCTRSLFEKHSCGYYHDPKKPCPKTNLERYKSGKWLNDNFHSDSVLYNYWHAQEKIKDTHTVVVVEGPADTWRLWEAGIPNCVALFGLEMTANKAILLDKAETLNVVLALDNDDAGKQHTKQIMDEYGRRFNISKLEYRGKDIGELSNDYIKSELMPVIKSKEF